MSKLIILLVVVAAAVSSINADDFFPGFPSLYNPFNFDNGFPQQGFQPLNWLNPDTIKNMKPGPGEVVNGASVSSSSSSETVNGVTKEKSSGRVVTNLNGKTTDVSY